MPEDYRLTDADEGKTVVTPAGEEIGEVSTVHDNVAAVTPHTGITDQIRSALGMGDGQSDGETYRLQAADVKSVSDDTVVLADDWHVRSQG